MAIEFRGDELLFAVEIEDEATGAKLIRPFNQTSGGIESEAEEIELNTKDKSGADYGNVTQTLSIEGIITEGDPFPNFIKKAQRNKELVKIYEVNKRTLKAEYGMYMISEFNREYENEEYATYELEGILNGSVCETTLEELPEGAPGSDGMDCDGDDGEDVIVG